MQDVREDYSDTFISSKMSCAHFEARKEDINNNSRKDKATKEIKASECTREMTASCMCQASDAVTSKLEDWGTPEVAAPKVLKTEEFKDHEGHVEGNECITDTKPYDSVMPTHTKQVEQDGSIEQATNMEQGSQPCSMSVRTTVIPLYHPK